MDEIYGWAEGIIVFVIISTVLLNLIVSGKYRKYLKLFIGMMLVLLVINPILSLFQMKDDYEIQFEVWDNFANSEESEDMVAAFANAEQARDEQILSSYKSSLTQQAEEVIESYGYSVVSMQVEIGEDEEMGDYYQVKSIEGVITKKGIEKAVNSLKEVEDVRVNEIPKVNLEEKKEEDTEKAWKEDETTKMLKSKIADFYNIKSENINIGIQEEETDGA